MIVASGCELRKFSRWQIAAVTAILLLATPAWAQEAGNSKAGHALARTWCVSCHVVDSAQKSASTSGPPTFMEVAMMPSTTTLSLHAFLTAPHAPMPDFQLSRQQIDDVTAYVLSLKQR